MIKKLKTFLIGTVELSDPAFRILKKISNLDLVITQKKNTYNSDHMDFKKKNIKVLEVENINSKLVENYIKKGKFELGFCVGWGQIIKKNIFQIPRYGIIGHHPTMLPYNKGKHPLTWAIFLNLKYTGSTFFQITNKIDGGSIYNQKKIKIHKGGDVRDLYNKVKKILPIQIKEIINLISNDRNFKKKLILNKTKNYWRKRDDFDSKIDFRMSYFIIERLVKALNKPYVGAHIIVNGKKIQIFKVKKGKSGKIFENLEPGKIIKISNNFVLVKCYDTVVKIYVNNFPHNIKYLK